MSRKISSLPAAASLTDADVVAGVEGGVTKRFSVAVLRNALFGAGLERVSGLPNSTGTEEALRFATGTVNAGIPADADSSTLFSGVALRALTASDVIRAADTPATAPALRFRRMRGTIQAPTPNADGDWLGLIGMTVRLDNNTFRSIGEIAAIANETPTAAASGVRWVLRGNPVGETTQTTWVTWRSPSSSVVEMVFGQTTGRVVPSSNFAIRNSTNTADAFSLNAAGTTILAPLATSFVVGADPGSSALLRVGGASRLDGRLTMNVGETVIWRAFNSTATVNERGWDFRIDNTGGAFELRSIQDGGTTVQTALRILHATGVITTAGALNVNNAEGFRVQGNKVLGARRTGWSLPTGSLTRTTFATGTVTLEQLAERVAALINDLHASGSSSTHGVLTT
jgi:hypothetical protein